MNVLDLGGNAICFRDSSGAVRVSLPWEDLRGRGEEGKGVSNDPMWGPFEWV